MANWHLPPPTVTDDAETVHELDAARAHRSMLRGKLRRDPGSDVLRGRLVWAEWWVDRLERMAER